MSLAGELQLSRLPCGTCMPLLFRSWALITHLSPTITTGLIADSPTSKGMYFRVCWRDYLSPTASLILVLSALGRPFLADAFFGGSSALTLIRRASSVSFL